MTEIIHNNIYYTCLFVEDKVTLLQKCKPVHKNIVAHHSTISYKPENLNGLAGFRVGHILKVKILGRVTDEFADAVLIEKNLRLFKQIDVLDRGIFDQMKMAIKNLF